MSDTIAAAATNRFKDALLIQQGASNPSGVARALVQAIGSCHQDGTNPTEDPAVRLIVQQLGHLCGTWEIFRDLDAHANLMARCEEGSVALHTRRPAT